MELWEKFESNLFVCTSSDVIKRFREFWQNIPRNNNKSLPEWRFLYNFSIILALLQKINNYSCTLSYASLPCSNKIFCKLGNLFFFFILHSEFQISKFVKRIQIEMCSAELSDKKKNRQKSTPRNDFRSRCHPGSGFWFRIRVMYVTKISTFLKLYVSI